MASHRTRPDPLRGVGSLQPFGKTVTGPLLRRYFRLRSTGADLVPRRGAVVLAANHESMWDIPLLVVACPRPIVFMAKQELFEPRAGAWVFRRLGGFPVHRSLRDLSAMKRSLDVIGRGQLLGLFPEGHRTPGRLGPFLPGAAWVALTEGVPVQPVGIRGTEGMWEEGRRMPRRPRVEVVFGAPIPLERDPDPRARRSRAVELTERVRADVARLLGR